VPKKSKPVELTEAQAEIVGQFNDYAFENPGKTFEEVVLKEFGPGLFPPTPQGKAVWRQPEAKPLKMGGPAEKLKVLAFGTPASWNRAGRAAGKTVYFFSACKFMRSFTVPGPV
jgi:hypothetical protein